MASSLHGISKIVIPDNIILKSGKLNEDEYEVIKSHTTKGAEISIAAQIISLVDVYDALISKRVYKAAYNTERAYQIIINGQSGSFSSKLLKAFTEVRKEFEIIVTKYSDKN